MEHSKSAGAAWTGRAPGNRYVGQPRTTDQIAKLDGANWVCADDLKVLQAQLDALQTQVATLENLLTHVSRDGKEIFITDANLHVVNGTGTSDGAPNSLGNVIIGYNEERGGGADVRSGSHMLVVGSKNNYSGFGGIVVGFGNETSGDYASISGGAENIASGTNASISGGQRNIASGNNASVSGGLENEASNSYTSVSGGQRNTASGGAASVSGGANRSASGGDNWAAGTLLEAN